MTLLGFCGFFQTKEEKDDKKLSIVGSRFRQRRKNHDNKNSFKRGNKTCDANTGIQFKVSGAFKF